MERSDVVPVLRRRLRSSGPEVIAAYLYGSLARGTARAGSDVDVAVLLDHAPVNFGELPLALEGRLEEALGRRVQIVALNDAPPDLVHRVLRDGLVLLDRDPSRRIAFEVRTRALYLDLRPHLLRYRRLEAAG